MAIESEFLDSIFTAFSLELPERNSLDQYIDILLPEIRHKGEDLREEGFYLNKRWLEIRDDENFHESILHIFSEEEEYMYVVEGNIHRGSWRKLPKSNTIIIDQVVDDAIVKSELYDLAFMDSNFFILKKHGNQKRIGKRKYFVMGSERAVRGLEWREVIEKMNQLRKDNMFMYMVIGLLLVVAIFLVLSWG